MRKMLSRTIIAGAVIASMMVPFGTTAIAGEVEDAPEASLNGAPIDSWAIVGNTVNALLGTTSCTISASTPVNDANLVSGSGSVKCNRSWPKLTLTVCIHGKPAFVSGDEGWQQLGCAPTKAALNSSSLSATATVPCQPGPWRYRTHVTSEGFRTDGEVGFAAMIQSSSALYDCFL